MDSIVSSALDEICSAGSAGLSLSALWTALSIQVSPLPKAAVWRSLLVIPALQFSGSNGGFYQHNDASIQIVEDAERLDLKVIAHQKLRDNFVGLYDSNANISAVQRRTLERLAVARTNGITQAQLGKEFGIEGNNLFYIMKNLECRGLIVRQPAVLKTKEACSEGEFKNSSNVTNLVYLYRYAKHLGSQQRVEISKEEGQKLDSFGNADETDAVREEIEGDLVKEGVVIKDYGPAMKAVCDKLDEASNKVLVVSDVKRDLGYIGSHSAHRAWRNVFLRLKDAKIVEEIDAKVNKKVERCLRLLKNFSPHSLEPKAPRNVHEQCIKFGRRLQKTDQLVDLPIEYQIYDMVDAEGSDGLTVIEVCDRLGIDKKKNYPRFYNLLSKLIHLQPENHKRTVAFRLWTSKNSKPEASNACSSNPKLLIWGNRSLNSDVNSTDSCCSSSQQFLEYDHYASAADLATPPKLTDQVSDAELEHDSNDKEKKSLMIASHGYLLDDPNNSPADAYTDLSTMEIDSNVLISEQIPLASSKELDSGSCHKYPYTPTTVDGALRETRILELLQAEKILLRGELYKWLVNLEKDKVTKLDRKTVDKIVKKLEKDGLCKTISVNVPVVTNCGRSKITQVVLHPSFEGLPHIIGEVHDRMRSFEKSRSLRVKNSDEIPVLDEVRRTQSRVPLDGKALLPSESMRNNGFVSAKMVRAKLLHIFLWSYVTSSLNMHDLLSRGDDLNSQNNPHSTYDLFTLDEAIKAVPVELFLQVAGSSLEYDDMIAKCNCGLSLSDLTAQEYKLLNDTKATERLSKVIDILQRLKLIRLVTKRCPNLGCKVPDATFTHAMELKPYIEEPLSIVPTSNLRSFDFRPGIRHDFFLASREAVDEYWHTLEYSFATADLRAGLHAFPGSAVHEVFHDRSWVSVRLMTADQRSQLLELFGKDALEKKLSYKECEKIAKSLNLSLQQVLSVYNDQQRQRLNFRGIQDGSGGDYRPTKHTSHSLKRKTSSERKSCKFAKVDPPAVRLEEERLASLSDAVEPSGEQLNPELPFSEEDDVHFPVYYEGDESGPSEGPGLDHDDELVDQVFAKQRGRRFLWTDEADRQMVIQYVRHRAALGPNFHRTDWALLSDLPAPPNTCKRRMALLRTNRKFRIALMNLCEKLSDRYVQHLEIIQKKPQDKDGCGLLTRAPSTTREGCEEQSSNHVKDAEEQKRWDDFDDTKIKEAFEDVLRYKPVGKIEHSKKLSDMDMTAVEHGSGRALPSPCTKVFQNVDDSQNKGSGRQSKHRRLCRKFIELLNKGTSVSRQLFESLPVFNAVELLKLVFLSSSTALKMQNLLAETLRRYSEHDLYAAFSYLRDKKILVGGGDNQPFELSQHFIHSLSRSPFPNETGNRASNFLQHLYEEEKDLIEMGINLTLDFQCGDMFQLFALVSSGELSISPSVPKEGVGEAEERTLKRKNEDDEIYDEDKAKRLKSLCESELISRREKGFPGIMLSMHRVTMSTIETLKMFNDVSSFSSDLHANADVAFCEKNMSSSYHSESLKEIPNLDCTIPIVGDYTKSAWESMAEFAHYLLLKVCDKEQMGPFSPEVFMTVCAAIQKSGDQGLSMEEICQATHLQGKEMAKLIIDVLQTFGRVLKVNAYDSIRIVDPLYHSKYFLTSTAGVRYDCAPPLCAKSQKVVGTNSGLHKVTILNLPKSMASLPNDREISDGNEGGKQGVESNEVNEYGGIYKFLYDESHMPILPWVNGDGTINRSVYSGLVRRMLGTVMQNPGMLEDDVIRRIDVLNPQSCRQLLELMVLDNHLIVKKKYQTTLSGPPALLVSLLGDGLRKSKSVVCRNHIYANPMSAGFL